MVAASESVTVTLPRTAVGGVLALSKALLDRMHELLEQNANGSLSPFERQNLEALVEMAQFSQIFSTAIQTQTKP
jgi:preprotein translocase subunit SecB